MRCLVYIGLLFLFPQILIAENSVQQKLYTLANKEGVFVKNIQEHGVKKRTLEIDSVYKLKASASIEELNAFFKKLVEEDYVLGDSLKIRVQDENIDSSFVIYKLASSG